MLNVSIKNFLEDTYFSGGVYAKLVLKPHVTITEKYDGTKLSFIKTGPGPEDWVLAYKGSILPKELFKAILMHNSLQLPWCVNGSDIKHFSYGFLQYKYVFEHLFCRQHAFDDIPVDTEVLLEFVQNKPTLLSDYSLHNMHTAIVIDAAPCVWHVDVTGSRVTTFPGKGNDALMDTVTRALGYSRPCVLFEGQLERPNVHGSRLKLPEPPHTLIDRDVWMEHRHKLESALTDFESSLGGKPEGVVVRVGTQLRKVVRHDQYDKAARAAKKARFRYADEAKEAEYWREVTILGRTWASSARACASSPNDLSSVMRTLASIVLCYKREHSIEPPRMMVNFIEDAMLTAKLTVERAMWADGANSIGVFVMAGKPVHIGHWKMIEHAAYENEKLLLIVSTKDRDGITGRQMFEVWKEVLEGELPKNVVLRFSDSPYVEAIRELKALSAETEARLAVYGDPHDIDKCWNPDVIRKKLPELANNRLRVFPIARESVAKVSGTDMRMYLKNRNYGLLMENLPPIDHAKKMRYCSILGLHDK